MPRIPLEDNYTDVIGKSQRGLGISDEQLCSRAQVTPEDLATVKGGTPIDAVIRRIARHLRLSPDALEDMAHQRWYPEQPHFKHGFAAFNTRYEDMTVNSYLVWDGGEKVGVAFDTGANCDAMLDIIKSERLRIVSIFLTHTHVDHIADLAKLAKATGADVWASEREPVAYPGASVFKENAHFHCGSLSIKTLLTSGHSPGQTTFYVLGLGPSLAVVGDSLFASSMGGSQTAFDEQYQNSSKKIMSLPRDTVLACGHGPLTTVDQEKRHNPFFAR
jgi:glyoxylase-like metal-dependent hydrolase (beta-lactamase superfamily II)